MIIPIELSFKADKDTRLAFSTNKTIKSHDVNSVEFHISIDGLDLTNNHTAKILSIFHSSQSQVNTDCEIVDGKIIYKPDTKLISMYETVTNYVYVYNDNQSVDVCAFKYNVDLSKIDETALEVKTVYDQSYADLLADFEAVLNNSKELLQDDSVSATITEVSQARGSYPSLNSRLDEITNNTGDLNQRINSDLQKLANKTLEVIDVTRPNGSFLTLKNDGVSDNYQAFQSLANYLNSRPNEGGIIYFPPGEYRIDQIVKDDNDGTPANGIGNVVYNRLANYIFRGYGAKITVKGNYHRKKTHMSGASAMSAYRSISPFEFDSCSNVQMEGFEVYGEADLMTKDVGITEGGSYGLLLYGVNNFVGKDLHIHHFHTDGVVTFPTRHPVNGKHLACRNVSLENVKSERNARQAITIGHVVGFNAYNCDFNYSGMTEGEYGGHTPYAGVDIEADYKDLADYNAVNVSFNNCRFVGNKATLTCAKSLSDNVTFNNCLFESDIVNNKGFILEGRNMTITNSILNVSHISLGVHRSPTNTILESNIINANLISMAEGNVSQVLVKNNKIVSKIYAVNSKGTKLINNQITLKKEFHKGTGTFDILMQLTNALVSKDNIFETDLVSETLFFASDYGTCRVVNDLYLTPNNFRHRYSSDGSVSLFSQ